MQHTAVHVMLRTEGLSDVYCCLRYGMRRPSGV